MPNLGDPDEESHDYVEDDHFDQEAWDRFLSEENHQRYGEWFSEKNGLGAISPRPSPYLP